MHVLCERGAKSSKLDAKLQLRFVQKAFVLNKTRDTLEKASMSVYTICGFSGGTCATFRVLSFVPCLFDHRITRAAWRTFSPNLI